MSRLEGHGMNGGRIPEMALREAAAARLRESTLEAGKYGLRHVLEGQQCRVLPGAFRDRRLTHLNVLVMGYPLSPLLFAELQKIKRSKPLVFDYKGNKYRLYYDTVAGGGDENGKPMCGVSCCITVPSDPSLL
ncbi:uncharacterized protein LOC117654063 [Thrips palmi]|uniref:Uncharacterized protein LOC117654063 n=1 Tax=Thrips palmi TaxID=161013 RepID=A0A6P9ACZ2_THRPL|nr:uncharacterized protein LOC117654063 [Thrips palmi]